LLEQGAHFVAFGRPWGMDKAAHSWVDVDGAAGTREAVHYLADLRHSRIAFLGFPDGSGVGDDRFQGWLQAMDELGLATKGLWARAENGITSGRALTDALLATPNPPTAVLCVSDAMAVGAMRAVEDRGLVPGRDVSVVGFDDSPVASVLRPQLSSVHQPLEAVAQKLVEVLLAELSGSLRRPNRSLLAPWLVARESSGEARPGSLRSSGTDGAPGKTVIALPKKNRKETK
jgi:DNA-binding LacI/PurR family transcriptional regulator